jgi:hypothetical protein
MPRASPVLGGNSCWTNKSIFMAQLGGRGKDFRVDIATTDGGGTSFVFSPKRPLGFGPTKSPKQWVPGDYALGLKRLEYKIIFHVYLVQN